MCLIFVDTFRIQYWNIFDDSFLRKHNVSITLANITLDSCNKLGEHFKFVEVDACNLSMFEDDHFSLVHSNSVIEHVGGWQRIKLFAEEVQRVAPRYYIQTPNFWFPIEVHSIVPFWHWLPLPIRAAMIRSFPVGTYPRVFDVFGSIEKAEEKFLLTRRMVQALFPNAKITIERFFGLPKSIIAIKE